MPTVVAHAVFGWSVATAASPALPAVWRRPAAIAAAALAMVPDADVVAFKLGIGYGDALGHRGASHSLVFAALAAGVAVLALRRPRRAGSGAAFAVLFAAAASHPLLDMLTDGGLGCALLAPISWARLFFPVRPIPVSPIGVQTALVQVMAWEAVLFLPLALAAHLLRAERRAAWHHAAVMALVGLTLGVGAWRVLSG
jgi:inner membrane protein